jgi:glutaredoxin
MKIIHTILSGIFLGLALSSAHAVTIYECVDEEGNSIFQDRCPPGTTPAGEKKFRTGATSEPTTTTSTGGDTPPDADITLYSAPECDACLIMRGVLEQYGAVFTEKNINQSDEVKKELQEKTGGSSTLTIPTTIFNETIIVGFKKDELISTLEGAGFKKPVSEEPPAEENTSVPETAENPETFTSPETEQEF